MVNDQAMLPAPDGMIAELKLRDLVEVNPNKVGGVPVLKGTRFPVAQLLSQVADGDSLCDIAENFDLDCDQIRAVFHALAAQLDRPLTK